MLESVLESVIESVKNVCVTGTHVRVRGRVSVRVRGRVSVRVSVRVSQVRVCRGRVSVRVSVRVSQERCMRPVRVLESGVGSVLESVLESVRNVVCDQYTCASIAYATHPPKWVRVQ